LKTIESNSIDQIGLGVNNCLSKTYLDVKNQCVEKTFGVRLSEDALAQINGLKNIDSSSSNEMKL
jgi:hypothetical protein